MTRTIKDLSAGTQIMLDEYSGGVATPVPYIVLPHAEGDTNVAILRLRASTQKRMNPSNVAVYPNCEADQWLENQESGFLSRFDAATLGALTTRAIKVLDYESQEVITIARTCFLLSYSEMGFATTPDEGDDLYTNGIRLATGSRVASNDALSNVVWWLRSPYSAASFRGVFTDGYAYGSTASGASYWLRPALAVSPDTIVSDQGEETIYLLPDPNKPYREASATIITGTSVDRPKKAKLQASTTNMYDLSFEVSNNAGDANPVWVPATPGTVVTLSNNTKETENWTIGVKIYGKSNGRGKVYEPVVIIETD